MKHLWEGGTNVFINNPDHMTKMAAMPIYGKYPSKIFSSGTGGPISTKLGMKHRVDFGPRGPGFSPQPGRFSLWP